MKLGGAELFVILLVAFFVLGPDRTVIYARKAGKWLRVLKTYISSMTEDLRETVVEPLEEMQEPLKEIWKPASQLKKEVSASADSISRSLQETSQDAASSPEKPVEDSSADSLEMAEFIDSVS